MGVKGKSRKLKYLSEGVDDFQPGSRKRVLRNKLGLVRIRQIEDAELAAYHKAEETLIRKYEASHRFRIDDIDEMHRLFLGGIYDWAGHHREVNISKGDFPFASAMAVGPALKDFEQNVLFVYTPCTPGDPKKVAQAIATVHVELLLIHPYREGNGRTARLLANLMAYQAGLPGLDFSFIGSKGKSFNQYVKAIQAGLDRNYGAMEEIILKAIKFALKRVE